MRNPSALASPQPRRVNFVAGVPEKVQAARQVPKSVRGFF